MNVTGMRVKGYKDLAEVCREQIRSGAWKAETRLPTIRTLAARFKVTSVTAQRAISELQADGYVRTEGRHGSFVASDWISRSASRSDSDADAERSTRSLRLGMVVDWPKGCHLVLPVLATLERLLTARLYSEGGIFHRCLRAADTAAAVEHLMEELRRMPLDALVLPHDAALQEAGLPARLRRAGVTCIHFTGTVGRTFDVDTVQIDDAWAFQEVIQWLSLMGHRDIAFVGLPPEVPGTEEWNETRLTSWKEAMTHGGHRVGADDVYTIANAHADLRVPEELREFRSQRHEHGYSQAIYGYAAGLVFNATRQTAAVCVNDNVAHGLIHALRDRGIRVPEDVSVTGYDNNPDVDVNRELTTFTLPEEQIADAILSLATRRLAGDRGLGDRMQVTLRPILIPRLTSAHVGKP